MTEDLDSPVSMLMTQDPVCIGPRVDLATASRLLIEHHVSGLPIVDDQNKPLGMFTHALALNVGVDPTKAVGEIDFEPSLVVSESTVVSEAIRILKRERQERLCVVSKSGALVGIVSALDLLRFVARHGGYLVERRRR